AARPQRRNCRIHVEEDVQESGAESAQQIEKQIGGVAVEVFDVIAKNPEEQHVAGDVQNPGVQEHAGEQRQEGGVQWAMPGKPGGEAGRNGGVGENERLKGVRGQGVLIKEDEDVDEDEGIVDEGI